MTWGAVILGLAIGFLIGLTGMGGGAMMTPILVWTGWAPPAVAVGTDIAWNAITKVVGAAVHYRENNVNLSLVRRLATGSIPGTLVGVYALGNLKRTAGGAYLDHLIVHTLGGTLIAVALSIVLREYIQRRYPHRPEKLIRTETTGSWRLPFIGFIIGVLVAFTSVGSGSLIITSLLLLFPGERLRNLVGSDVFHGLLMVGVAAIGHWYFGHLDLKLMAGLLCGSVPGVSLGSMLAGRIPERALRPAVAMLLFVTGVKLV